MKLCLNIYVASSWRNEHQPTVVKLLAAMGHKVYDFRNPPNGAGFHWEQVALERDADGLCETLNFAEGLNHERAIAGYRADKDALDNSDVCVLVLPCGKSAHLELGYAIGNDTRSLIYHPAEAGDRVQPELMYKLADKVVFTVAGLVEYITSQSQSWMGAMGR